MRELSALCSQNMWWVPLCLWHWLFLWGSRCIQHFPPSGMFPLLPEGSENINQTLHHTQFSSVTEKKKLERRNWQLCWFQTLHFDFFFLTCILSNTPVLSILLATFTELPQISYWGLWAPITPAITGPWFIPASDPQRGVNKCLKPWDDIISMCFFVFWIYSWNSFSF